VAVVERLLDLDVGVSQRELATDHVNSHHVFGVVVFGVPPPPVAAPDVLLDPVRFLSDEDVLG
jgi:hypothetical protein